LGACGAEKNSNWGSYGKSRTSGKYLEGASQKKTPVKGVGGGKITKRDALALPGASAAALQVNFP
jgi:hypothetical protein